MVGIQLILDLGENVVVFYRGHLLLPHQIQDDIHIASARGEEPGSPVVMEGAFTHGPHIHQTHAQTESRIVGARPKQALLAELAEYLR